MGKEVIRLEKIVKDFPGVKALDNVNFVLNKGEVCALLGENGAGKSTLIKIIMGLYSHNKGDIYLNNKKVEINDTKHAKALGIDAIYQEQNLCPDLTVAENIYTGRLLKRNIIPLINWRKLYKSTQKLLKNWNVDFKETDKVSTLNVSQRQIVEILKVITESDLKVLILDEPTAALNEDEIKQLFGILEQLKKKGISIIYISHRLDEVFDISDKITVLRDGKNVGTLVTKNATKDELINLMIGRKLNDMYPKRKIKKGEYILEIKNLCSGKTVRDISFSLKEGEILGLYGLLGSGKKVLGKSLFGRSKIYSGTVSINGKKVNIGSVSDAVSHSIGFIPADRKRNGIIDILNVRQNLTLANTKDLGKLGFINSRIEKDKSSKWVETLHIKTPSLETSLGNLSGGNQQKVVIGKWLDSNSKILILNEPTHGVDVGGKVEIYNIIEDLCEDGVGIIMISSEIPELTSICDRVLVMFEGRIAGELKSSNITQENILKLAMSKNK